MSADSVDPPLGRIERLDQESLTICLRQAADKVRPDRLMDDLELQHLMRVITECSLLLTDVYSEERIARIMHPERGFLTSLIDQLIERQRRDEGEVLYRVRRLPDDVRVVGDKALFDAGLLGLREIKGFDLEELGTRAYNMAGEALELLAEDQRLKKFFKDNRLLMLPLEEEVVFLHQCSDKFRFYAEILRRTLEVPPRRESHVAGAGESAVSHVPPPAVASVPPVAEENAPAVKDDDYLDAARGGAGDERDLTREQFLSNYERVLLFASLDLERFRHALDATVIDQQGAVETLCDELSLYAAGTRDLTKPPAYFLVGPTGVGKNHMVESLRRLLEGLWSIEIPMLTIEGPNYTYPSDINELRGATRGFIRSDEEGLLTSFHESSSRSPFSILLIDEVEKAHSQLLTYFLSIMDRGTTTDNRGTVLNFSNCMLFFTSNLGYSDAQQRSSPIGYMEEADRVKSADNDIRRELKRTLKPEFVNRVRMVHFNRLTRSSVDRILDLELHRIAERYSAMHGLKIELDDSARAELIRRGFSPTYGARHLAKTLDSICNVEIAKRVRHDDRKSEVDRGAVVDWLRKMKAGERPFDPKEVRRRVLKLARADLGYDTLRLCFREGQFEYRPVDSRKQ